MRITMMLLVCGLEDVMAQKACKSHGSVHTKSVLRFTRKVLVLGRSRVWGRSVGQEPGAQRL